MNDVRKAISQLGPTEIDDAWLHESLRHFARTRDICLRDEIACRTSQLALRSARRFWNRGEPLEDLVQVANIGLLKAIDGFDPSKAVHFYSYATPTIMGELRRHFRDYTWSLHVPRTTKDMRATVNSARDNLENELGRSPQASEIASYLKVSEDSIVDVLTANNSHHTYSLEQTKNKCAVTSDSTFDDVLNHEVITELIHQLHPRQRAIIYLHYFEDLNQVQISQQIGMSQVHVGRLIATSLEQMRRFADQGHGAQPE